MNVRFLLGVAGSGKTFRCLREIRDRLRAEPDGPKLILLAPKQATFQLEAQLLASGEITGFSRLHILSFDRLAREIIAAAPVPNPELLDDSGRTMVLRALMESLHGRLTCFQSSARHAGFIRELGGWLRLCQRHQLGPAELAQLADSHGVPPTLRAKLRDSALILSGYRKWLDERRLRDADVLPDIAVEALSDPCHPWRHSPPEGLWMDGFAELTPQETDLLASVVSITKGNTLAFCLDPDATDGVPWHSGWASIAGTYRQCLDRLSLLPGMQVTTEALPAVHRFDGSPVLASVASSWLRNGRDPAGSTALRQSEMEVPGEPSGKSGATWLSCETAAHEASVMAAEVLRHTASGGRYREIAVLLRSLDTHAAVIEREFRRKGIPFFTDTRDSLAQHPVVEFTRNALRCAADAGRLVPWTAAVKSGVPGPVDERTDRWENDSLAGAAEDIDRQPVFPGALAIREFVRRTRGEISGSELIFALHQLWDHPEHRQRFLRHLGGDGERESAGDVSTALEGWIHNVQLAFSSVRMSLVEWLPILEEGLRELTLGRVPPTLDQVLIGAIDRSRNPDLALVMLPGWNDGVFPSPPPGTPLLNDFETAVLEQFPRSPVTPASRATARERFYAYIALTRSRRQAVLTSSRRDGQGTALHPSPFLAEIPGLQIIEIQEASGPRRSRLEETPAATECIVRHFVGSDWRISPSALEKYAECPFRFFALSMLRGREREELQLDGRQRGQFQHLVLEKLHHRLVSGGRSWRQWKAEDALQVLDETVKDVARDFADGFFNRHGENRESIRVWSGRLQIVVTRILEEFKSYRLDPVHAELRFGSNRDAAIPPLVIPVDSQCQLHIHGSVDRIDLGTDPTTGRRWVTVMDYKSGSRKYSEAEVEKGVLLQLPLYLMAAVEVIENASPAGFAYVSLRPKKMTRSRQRPAGEAGPEFDLNRGLFHWDARELIESPTGPGTQLYKLDRLKSGEPSSRGDWRKDGEFQRQLDVVHSTVRRIAAEVLSGQCDRKPLMQSNRLECDGCVVRGVCRIDAT